ncbi:MAG: glycosyltransferase family protein [Fimbriimonadales bacterium]
MGISQSLFGECRAALYSHDTMGLGHMRRNLMIAQCLTGAEPHPSILMIAGAAEIGAFARPKRVDLLSLPSYKKDSDGYSSRSLDLNLGDLVNLRSQTMLAALDALEPDLLLIDKVPGGACGELLPSLVNLRRRGRTKIVLGLRDVLDEPEAVCSDWERDNCDELIERFFHEIWVYGDPKVYDPVLEYGFPETTTRKIRYTGYLDPIAARPTYKKKGPTFDPPYVLCMVGGGQDGAKLAHAFADADYGAGIQGVIVTGPFMPRADRRHLEAVAKGRDDLTVLKFTETTQLLLDADKVVAMGGYNSVCEILSARKDALIVPRVEPRREQIIRAERLRDLGLIDMLEPCALNSEALGDWLKKPAATRSGEIRLEGNGALPMLMCDLIGRGCAEEPRRGFASGI